MKKTVKLILAAALVFSLTGCGNSDADKEQDNMFRNENYNYISLKDLNSQLEEQTEAAKSKEYPNIVFDDEFTVFVPNADKAYNLQLTIIKNLSPRECFSEFDRIFDLNFSDIYDDEGKKEIYRFRPSGEDAERLVDDSKGYPQNLPLLYDYKEEVLNGSIKLSEFVVDTDNAYLEMFSNGYVHGFSRGNARAIYKPVEPGDNIGFWTPSREIEGYAAHYNDLDTNISYQLHDKETAIREAAQTVQEQLESGNLGKSDQFKPQAVAINVVDLGDRYYGYDIKIAKSYKGINFLVAKYASSDGGYRGSYTGKRNYSRSPGNAFMFQSSEIETIVGYDTAYDVTELSEYDSVISFEDAVQCFSDTFANNMEFNINSAELVYGQYPIDSTNEEFKTDIVWNFEAENIVQNEIYDVFINAIDGSCTYVR